MVSTAAKSGIRCIVGVQGMTSPKTGATHYHVQLGLPDNAPGTALFDILHE